MRFFLSAIFFFLFTNTIAQLHDELRFHKISDELLQGVDVSRFFPTRDGLLWFASNKGLASFDGSQMVYYGNRGLGANTNYSVFDLGEDQQGNLWITSPEYGLVFFNRAKGVFKKIEVSIDQRIPSSEIFLGKIFIDRQGMVWIGTGDRGFFSYDPRSNQLQHYIFKPGMPEDWESRYENTARNFMQDIRDSNIIWIANYGSGIFSFNKKTKQLKTDFKNLSGTDTSWRSKCITGLFQTNDTTIWFHTWGYGMGEYNIKTGYFRCYLSKRGFTPEVPYYGHIIEYAAEKSDSEFYLAPRDTIPAIFNTISKKYTYINDAELDREYEKTLNVKAGANNNLYYLKGGSLFISSPRYNLFRNIALGKRINTLFPELNCILWNPTTRTYFAGILLGEGVYEYDENMNLIRKIPMPPFTGRGFYKTTTIWKLHRDKANHLWALGFETCVYDSATSRFVPVHKKWPQLKLLRTAMHDVTEDKDGILYFNSYKNELITLNPFLLTETKIFQIEKNSSRHIPFYDNWVLSDNVHNVLYFSGEGNLFQYHLGTKDYKKLYIDSSYFRNPVSQYECSYTLDEKGIVWMSTPDHYLWKIDPDQFKITDTVKFSNSFIDITGARLYGAYQNYLLISTTKSQILFNTENHQWIYLDRNNGLLMNRPAREMVCNGNVFFSFAGTGRAQYAPILLLLQSPRPRIPFFTSILINNHPYVSDSISQYMKKLILDYWQNSISIVFSTVEDAFPTRMEYAYKLDNADNEWSYTNNLSRQINYADLSSGQYVFRVKVREWGHDWSPETSLFITITPPFWKTWWFIGLIIISISGIIFWIAQWRINSIRKHEQLRAKHEKDLLELEAKALRAQMNPHFIFNCLNSIKALIQQNDHDRAVMYLTTFSKLIRIIFQNSDQREVSLYDEIETCKLYAQLEGMRYGKKINYHFNIDDSLDLKSIRVPALIIQPFIENAIWHGIMPRIGEGTVNISVKECDHSICCIIDDDGIGRELSVQNKFQAPTPDHQSKGIHLTQSRLDLDNTLNTRNAGLEITDKKDARGKPAGTTVLLTFKEY